MREVLQRFVNQKVKLTCVFGVSEPIFYLGTIKRVNDDSVVLLDKFGKLVVVSLDSIKKVEVDNNEHQKVAR